MFVGHDQIDTHAMELDPHIAEIVQSLRGHPACKLDPAVEVAEHGLGAGG